MLNLIVTFFSVVVKFTVWLCCCLESCRLWFRTVLLLSIQIRKRESLFFEWLGSILKLLCLVICCCVSIERILPHLLRTNQLYVTHGNPTMNDQNGFNATCCRFLSFCMERKIIGDHDTINNIIGSSAFWIQLTVSYFTKAHQQTVNFGPITQPTYYFLGPTV